MSWLEDIKRDFKYRCGGCGTYSTYELTSSDPQVRDPHSCLECGSLAEYVGFKPLTMGGMTKVLFEKNGRKAYAITDSSGKTTYRSVTKDTYLETGNITANYSHDYERSIKDRKRFDLLKTVTRDEIIDDREQTRKKVKERVTLINPEEVTSEN